MHAVHFLDESALPVTEKERKGEGKSSIGPRMKYGHANLQLFLIGHNMAFMLG